MANESRNVKLTRYFGQQRGKFGVYLDEKWCLDAKVHVFRWAANLPFGGGWQTIKTKYLGNCDGEECKYYTTSDGKEERRAPLDKEKGDVMDFRFDELPPDFKQYL